jgi:CHAT domain-containing protein
VLLGILTAFFPSIGLAQASASEVQSLMDRGFQSLQIGAFEQAALDLSQAALAAERAQRPLEQSDALIATAHAYEALGYYGKAVQALEIALALVQGETDPSRRIKTLAMLGQVQASAGRVDAATDSLETALRQAKEGADRTQLAGILNNLGLLRMTQRQPAEALRAFLESWEAAEPEPVPDLRAHAAVNAARTLLQLGRFDESQAWQEKALEAWTSAADSHDKAYGLIALGLASADLAEAAPALGSSPLLRANTVLRQAAKIAEAIGDRRALSYALGHQGHLYETSRRDEEALWLTRKAVSHAQQIEAPESLYRWQWQTGRLLVALDQPDEALLAYRRAAETLQSIRPEIAAGAIGTGPTFREAAGPLFLELADLLLRKAANTTAPPDVQPLLQEARNVVEALKAAELRDYFQDNCVDALRSRTKSLDVVSQTSVVIYPILLKDRTELLVNFPDQLTRFTVPVPADRMTEEIRVFRRKLGKRTTHEYLPHAQQLYEWLIRPLEPSLAAHPINTLVVVPDGPLRTIPLAALHDGKDFLIAKYAVATTPGLNLTDPRPLQREGMKLLAAGLTDGVQGFPALPNVGIELKMIEILYGTPPILNGDFRMQRLEQELRDKQFGVVHLASHGMFGGRVQDTFILTFDDRMNMDRLSQVVGYFRFRDEPLELLTLSACETAAGDDRAALGLAGIAIKAGARSALATLWFINDAASSNLVSDFYKELQRPAVSKAEALRLAQLRMLNDPLYQHPAYWAPFLLLNNWL